MGRDLPAAAWQSHQQTSVLIAPIIGPPRRFGRPHAIDRPRHSNGNRIPLPKQSGAPRRSELANEPQRDQSEASVRVTTVSPGHPQPGPLAHHDGNDPLQFALDWSVLVGVILIYFGLRALVSVDVPRAVNLTVHLINAEKVTPSSEPSNCHRSNVAAPRARRTPVQPAPAPR